MREALEAYLGVRPTDRPTPLALPDVVSDALSDLSGRMAALTTAMLDIEARVERLEARETSTQRNVGRNRSGCQNRTLVITSSDGVPCAHGHPPLIATGTLGTDSA